MKRRLIWYGFLPDIKRYVIFETAPKKNYMLEKWHVFKSLKHAREFYDRNKAIKLTDRI